MKTKSRTIYAESEGRLKDYLNMLRSNPTEGHVRTQLATAILLRLWHDAGLAWGGEVPSMLLVRSEQEHDPIDELIRPMTDSSIIPDPIDADNPESPYSKARFSLEASLNVATNPKRQRVPGVVPECVRDRIHLLKGQCFGSEEASRYSRAWDDNLGLIPGESGHTTLRIDTEADYARMRQDILQTPERFGAALGLSFTNFEGQEKSYAVSGSLRVDQWDHELVGTVLEHGLPILFLPHTAADPLGGPCKIWRNEIYLFRLHLRTQPCNPSTLALPNRGKLDPETESFERLLSIRLAFLPGAYRFFITRTLRRLLSAAVNVADFVSERRNDASTAEVFRPIYNHALRSMALGVASLSYHCYGISIEQTEAEARAVLNFVRSNSGTSRREIMRRYRKLDANRLEALLKLLRRNKLVTLVGDKHVIPVKYEEFVGHLEQLAFPDAPQR